MKPEVAEIHDIISGGLTVLRQDLGLPALPEVRPETPILGAGSDLDSMAVVHLIVELEARLLQRYGLNWILADERALSRSRSPFRSVGDLAEFILNTQPEA